MLLILLKEAAGVPAEAPRWLADLSLLSEGTKKDPIAVTVKVLQVNLNYCSDARALLRRTTEVKKVDVVVQEPLYNPGDWHYDLANRAAIWVAEYNGFHALEDKIIRGDRYTGVVIGNLMIVTCYLRPNILTDELKERVDRLEEIQASWRGLMFFAGDFNAKSPAWRAEPLNERGAILLDATARMEMHLVDTEDRFSVLDFTFCDGSTQGRIQWSKVLGEIIRSDRNLDPERIRLLINGIFERGRSRTGGNP